MRTSVIIAVATLLGLASLSWGVWAPSPGSIGGAAILLGYAVLRGLRLRGRSRRERSAAVDTPRPAPRPARPRVIPRPTDPNDTDALVAQMLAQGRYAFLLRPQIAGNLDAGHVGRAIDVLHQAMALVPDGEVVLGRIDEALDDGELDEEELAATEGRVIQVQRFLLDRYLVTNARYYEFVVAGGYQQVSLWDESIWPAVLDFTDTSDQPGPRFWNHGCYAAGEEDLPVVGVSWYEAAAYARWLGKRLPTDAEWVKAGSWPVTLSATSRSQRRYPWGEAMDRTKANLWGSGPGRIVPVGQFAEGVSVGGIYQLIGNVWEWTAGDFRGGLYAEGELELPAPMKSIRGGAFDTYFDNQATCHFQSGEHPLMRRHNIGFRCAVGVCDLVLTPPAHSVEDGASPADGMDAEPAEVDVLPAAGEEVPA